MHILVLNCCILPPGVIQKLVRHRKDSRLEAIVQFIQENGFDLVFLQEVYGDKRRRRLEAHAQELGYHVFMDDKYNKMRISTGLVILSKEPLTDCESHLYRERTLVEQGICLPRGFITARTVYTRILLFNTHLTPGIFISRGNKDRTVVDCQLSQLDDVFQEKRSVNWIIAGDFNLELQDARLHDKYFYRHGYHEDTQQGSMNPNVPFNLDTTAADLRQSIDHLFSNRRAIASEKQLVNLSDHYPLLVTVDL